MCYLFLNIDDANEKANELIKEGNALDHCVGKMNYDQKFAREESLIFFVRNKDNPQIPSYNWIILRNEKKYLFLSYFFHLRCHLWLLHKFQSVNLKDLDP